MLRMLKHKGGRHETAEIVVTDLVIAGWTGRDMAVM